MKANELKKHEVYRDSTDEYYRLQFTGEITVSNQMNSYSKIAKFRVIFPKGKAMEGIEYVYRAFDEINGNRYIFATS